MISVCFITKNEEPWLGECIEHLRPLVSEFIVMDTGSTDATLEIARRAGARVESMEWPDDFAVARNASLALATKPWVLKIDPDERIDSSDFERIRELTNTETPCFQFWTRAYTNDYSSMTVEGYRPCQGEFSTWENGYRGFVTYPNNRLFQRLPGVKYVGKVHETIEPTLPGYRAGHSPIPEPLDIYVHHYGHNQEAISEKKKGPLYQRLIREELKENPDNWYAWFEQGLEYFKSGQLTDAIHAYREADRAHPNKPQVVSNLGYSLCLVGQSNEGERVLKDCLRVDADFHDAWLNLGASRMMQGDFSMALYYFDECLKRHPHSFLAYRGRGQAVAQLGEVSDSEQSFRAALRILPEFLEARVDLAFLLHALQRKSEAKTELEFVLERDPNHERAKALLAQG